MAFLAIPRRRAVNPFAACGCLPDARPPVESDPGGRPRSPESTGLVDGSVRVGLPTAIGLGVPRCGGAQRSRAAARGASTEIQRSLASRLDQRLLATADPRALGHPPTWESDPHGGLTLEQCR